MSASLASGLRQALRSLAARPGMSALVVLTLALAIGCNAAMFGVVRSTLLTPLPFQAPHELVGIWETTPEGHDFSASDANFLDYRERSTSFSAIAAGRDLDMTLIGAGDPVRLRGQAVSRNWFGTLGVSPAMGRGFTEAEDAPGADAAVVVLGHGLWTQRFGADPRVLGSELVLDGRSRTVVGVMPEGFAFLGAGYWLPLAADAAGDRGDHWLQMIGRLAPGVAPGEAAAELDAIATALGREHPAQSGWGARLRSFDDWLVGEDFRQTAMLLSGAVALLLLMACANIGSVLFARALRRRPEMALRAALGAGRGRLVRQQLVEVLLLVAAGVVLGLALAHGLVALLQAFGAGAVPRLEQVRVDAVVAMFATALGLLVAVVFAVGPVLRASRVSPATALSAGARGGVSRSQRRWSDGLVVLQVAAALVLVVGAGLLFRSLLARSAADIGFDAGEVHAAEITLGDRHAEPWQKVVFVSELSRELEALPGVAAVGASNLPPFGGFNFMNDVTPVDRAAEAGERGLVQARWRAVTPGFFEATGLPLLRGRVFDEGDAWDGPRLVVLSRALAEQLWPGQDAVGRELYWGGIGGTPRVVAGVVADFQDVEAGGEPVPVMFIPYNQLPWPSMTLLLRAQPGGALPTSAVREAIHRMDPTMALPTVTTVQARMAESIAGSRLRSLLLAGFSAMALLLAAVGVHGVTAAGAAQRQREFGLRMALGAGRPALLRLVLGSGLRLGLLGGLLGLAGAWLLARGMQHLLYGPVSLDLASLLASGAALLLVMLAAALVPAWRASRVDPASTLQSD